MSDYRRMNVAITRAKHCLFLVGNSQTLKKDTNWSQLINYCKSKSSQDQRCFTAYDSKDDEIKTNRLTVERRFGEVEPPSAQLERETTSVDRSSERMLPRKVSYSKGLDERGSEMSKQIP